MRGIVKKFGSLTAVAGADLELAPGEVHGLIGQNGAGKTTLMRVLFGMEEPTAGTISIDGEEVEFRSPRDSLAVGIGMVHQHFMLVDGLTVAENVVLGSRRSLDRSYRRRDNSAAVAKVAAEYGVAIDPDVLVDDLPIGYQQSTEILKQLYRGARVLILDEPTAALGPAEVEILMATIRRLKDLGRTIVIITHKLSEVVAIADRVTVLRDGAVVEREVAGKFDEHSLAVAMVGAEPPKPVRSSHAAPGTTTRLRLENLVVKGDGGEALVDDVSLDIHEGEVVGVAGAEGNGQRELSHAVTGMVSLDSGRVSLDDADLTDLTPNARRRAHLGMLSEDRLRFDVIPELSVTENSCYSGVALGGFRRLGVLDRRAMRAHAEELIDEYQIRVARIDRPIAALSGGNQQKLAMGRELAVSPRALVVSQPTRGLDIAAAAFVQNKLLELKAAGAAILLFSLDLDELLRLSDRVVVLYRGAVNFEAAAEQVSVGDLGRAMAGLEQRR
jgi:general nucleoside transport system ATP-binding protein